MLEYHLLRAKDALTTDAYEKIPSMPIFYLFELALHQYPVGQR